jgi:hypothetical protein
MTTLCRNLPSVTTLAPIRSESQLQAALIRWARAHADARAHLLFHVPNGGARDGRTGGVMVALGARSGVPDLFLPVPVVTQHAGMARTLGGLWLELKWEDGSLSDAQKRWLRTLAHHGYAIALAWDLDTARAAVTAYLAGSYEIAHADALAHVGDGPVVA